MSPATARPHEPTRREMLSALLGASAALALPAHPCAAPAPPRPDGRLSGRRIRIGVCDWSLGLASDPGALELAAELGLEGVMASFGAPGGTNDLRRPEVRRLYREAAAKHGAVVSSLGMGILNSVPYASDPRTEEWVSDAVDAARAMGVRVVLLAFFGKGDLRESEAARREVARRLRRVAPQAERAGVILGIESWLDAAAHVRILDAVGSPNVQVYYDLGNSRHRGYDICRELRWLGRERVCELHAKDYAARLFGQGEVDFWKVREVIDEIGYEGWILIEGRTPLGLRRSYLHDRCFLEGLFHPRSQQRPGGR